TIPADQRLAGSGIERPAAVGRGRGARMGAVGTQSPSSASVSPPQEMAKAIPDAASSDVIPDRQTIARIVEQVFAARGISRGGSSKANSTPQQPHGPTSESRTSSAGPAEIDRAKGKASQESTGAPSVVTAPTAARA